ncbi:MAG: SPASM domain-containing protein [Chloroflexi bacterium]|nr:SPASM domain-containing protein [Chloroflexota bacterium]
MINADALRNRFHGVSRLGVNVLVDGETGALYELDDEASRAFSSGEDIPAGSDVHDEFLSLFSFSGDEAIKKAAKRLEESPRMPKAMCLHMAEDCNLRCRYCFRNDSETAGGMMSLEDGTAAVEFLLSMPGRAIELDYFGGEPLLNWDMLKELVPYAEKRVEKEGKSLRQALTSNCLLLDSEKIAFLKEHRIPLTLSLDGPPEVHDLFRLTPGGSGSFERVFPNLMAAIEAGCDVCVRGTYTKDTINFADTVKFLVEEAGIKTLSLEPVTGCGDWSITSEDLGEIESQYEKLALFYDEMRKKEKPFDFYHFRLPLYNFPCLEKRLTGCGAGAEYLALGADGIIYPCHRFAGKKEWAMGAVGSPVWDGDIHKKFRRNSWIENDACSPCWAKLFCGGGCPASRYEANGDISVIDELSCSLFRLRLEFAIALEVLNKGTKDAIKEPALSCRV